MLRLILSILLLTPAIVAQAADSPDALWSHDPAAFLNAAPARRWIIGRSTGPCLSPEEATAQAFRDAAEQIVAPLPSGAERDWLRPQIESNLRNGRVPFDRSVARVQRPYAELWRATVLIDASTDRITALERDYHLTRAHRRASLLRLAALAALAIPAILLITALANALTRGYFRRRLHLGAAASILLVASVVFWLLRSTASG